MSDIEKEKNRAALRGDFVVREAQAGRIQNIVSVEHLAASAKPGEPAYLGPVGNITKSQNRYPGVGRKTYTYLSETGTSQFGLEGNKGIRTANFKKPYGSYQFNETKKLWNSRRKNQ